MIKPKHNIINQPSKIDSPVPTNHFHWHVEPHFVRCAVDPVPSSTKGKSDEIYSLASLLKHGVLSRSRLIVTLAFSML